MPNKSAAQDLVVKADNKAKQSKGWFSSETSKWEEAGDLYQQAANAFKLDKLFREAGDAFAREAECREKCKEGNEAANAWWNASKAYKRGFPNLAVQALSQAIIFLTQSGRFRQAADREKEIGQIYLQDLQNVQKACESFERAGEWYAQEDAHATANACFKDAADMYADLKEYNRAILRYEQVANYYLQSQLTKYSVKEVWLRSGLCALAFADTVTAKRNMAKYSTQDSSFAQTREAKFLKALIEAVEGGDQEAFTGAVVEFDKVTSLDNWKTNILLTIKKLIHEEEGLT